MEKDYYSVEVQLANKEKNPLKITRDPAEGDWIINELPAIPENFERKIVH